MYLVDSMTTTRLDLIKDGEVVLIVRKDNQPFKIKEKLRLDSKVIGTWLLTGEVVSLSGGEATLPFDEKQKKSLISELLDKRDRIDNSILEIKKIKKN